MVTGPRSYSRSRGHWNSGGRRRLCRRRRDGLRGCWYSISRTRRTEYARLHLGHTPAGEARRLHHPHRPERPEVIILLYTYSPRLTLSTGSRFCKGSQLFHLCVVDVSSCGYTTNSLSFGVGLWEDGHAHGWMDQRMDCTLGFALSSRLCM